MAACRNRQPSGLALEFMDQAGPIGYTEAVTELGQALLDSNFGDMEGLGDFLIGLPLGYHVDDELFPRRQRLKGIASFPP